MSRATLVRLIRAAADPDEATPLVLGVDDFTLRKGHVYDTILAEAVERATARHRSCLQEPARALNPAGWRKKLRPSRRRPWPDGPGPGVRRWRANWPAFPPRRSCAGVEAILNRYPDD